MNNQDQVPTIAELWGRLEDILQASAIFGLGYTESIQSLRQQLLERSKEFGYEGMRICEIWGDGKPENRIFHSRTCQFLKAEEAREFASALMFWAWELEQREKEASGD